MLLVVKPIILAELLTGDGTRIGQNYLQDRPLAEVPVPQVPTCAEERGTTVLWPLALPDLRRCHPGAGQREVSLGAEREFVKL